MSDRLLRYQSGGFVGFVSALPHTSPKKNQARCTGNYRPRKSVHTRAGDFFGNVWVDPYRQN